MPRLKDRLICPDDIAERIELPPLAVIQVMQQRISKLERELKEIKDALANARAPLRV